MEIKEASLYSKLLEILYEYKALETVIPGVDTTVSEFIGILEAKTKEYEALRVKWGSIDRARNLLAEVASQRGEFVKRFSGKVREIMASDRRRDVRELEDALNQTQRELERRELELSGLQDEYNTYLHECGNRGFSESACGAIVEKFESDSRLRVYSCYSPGELKEKVMTLTEEINSATEDVRKIEYKLEAAEKDKSILEKKKAHEYQDQQDRLAELFDTSYRLQQRIQSEYEGHLDALMKESVIKDKLTRSQSSYYEQVSLFLGKKVAILRHVDNEYEVERIDLVEDQVKTKSGKVIKLTDLGTGQSQSAYIKGLLSQRDDRKMVALIDEVAMMDSKSLEPIYDQLRTLYDEGALLLGLVVQRSDELKVTSLISEGTDSGR
jgi:exonuclease SbcC